MGGDAGASVIELTDVSKVYASGELSVEALRSVNPVQNPNPSPSHATLRATATPFHKENTRSNPAFPPIDSTTP